MGYFWEYNGNSMLGMRYFIDENVIFSPIPMGMGLIDEKKSVGMGLGMRNWKDF